MPLFDIKRYYDDNRDYYGDASLDDVAKDAYAQDGWDKQYPSYDDFKKQVGIADQVEYDSIQRAEAAKKARPTGVLRRLVGDPLVSAAKGVVGLGEAAVGLADIPTMGYAGKGLEALGYRPKSTQESLEGLYSNAQQEANLRVQQAKGFLPTVTEAVKNPSTIAHSVIESVPSMLGGFGIGRKVLQSGLAGASKLAPAIAGAIGEGAVTTGSSAEAIRQETESGTLSPVQVLAATGSGIATALIGVAGGKLARRFGLDDIDALGAGGKTADILDPKDLAKKKNIFRRVIESAISEGAFEELPQSMQEQMLQNVALGKPAGEGVAEAGAQGMLAGFVMGGGAPFMQGGSGRKQTVDPNAVVPPVTPPVTPQAGPISGALQKAGILPKATDTDIAGATSPGFQESLRGMTGEVNRMAEAERIQNRGGPRTLAKAALGVPEGVTAKGLLMGEEAAAPVFTPLPTSEAERQSNISSQLSPTDEQRLMRQREMNAIPMEITERNEALRESGVIRPFGEKRPSDIAQEMLVEENQLMRKAGSRDVSELSMGDLEKARTIMERSGRNDLLPIVDDQIKAKQQEIDEKINYRLSKMQQDVNAAEGIQRGQTDDGKGGMTGPHIIGSDYPAFFRDLNKQFKKEQPEYLNEKGEKSKLTGLDKKAFNQAIDRYRSGEKTTGRDDLIFSYLKRIAPDYVDMSGDVVMGDQDYIEEIQSKGFEPVKGLPIQMTDLNPGDKFIIDGEEFEFKDFDDKGNAVIEDGKTYRVDPFSTFNADGLKQGEQKPVAQRRDEYEDPEDTEDWSARAGMADDDTLAGAMEPGFQSDLKGMADEVNRMTQAEQMQNRGGARTLQTPQQRPVEVPATEPDAVERNVWEMSPDEFDEDTANGEDLTGWTESKEYGITQKLLKRSDELSKKNDKESQRKAEYLVNKAQALADTYFESNNHKTIVEKAYKEGKPVPQSNVDLYELSNQTQPVTPQGKAKAEAIPAPAPKTPIDVGATVTDGARTGKVFRGVGKKMMVRLDNPGDGLKNVFLDESWGAVEPAKAKPEGDMAKPESTIPTRQEYFKDVTIGEKTLEQDIQKDRSINGQTFRYTKFDVSGENFFAIERDRQGWNRGKEYEVQNAAGDAVQSLIRDGRRISVPTAKNRKELAYKFQTLVEDGWEPIDSYYYEHKDKKSEVVKNEGEKTEAETLLNAKAQPIFARVRDVYGKYHYLNQFDIDNQTRTILPVYTKAGERITGPGIHRDNLDPDGEKQKARNQKNTPDIIVKEGNGRDESFASIGAAKARITKMGLQDTHEVIPAKEVGGQDGFVIRKKQPVIAKQPVGQSDVPSEQTVEQPSDGAASASTPPKADTTDQDAKTIETKLQELEFETVLELRRLTGLPKDRFDAAFLKLVKDGTIQGDKHAHPAQADPDEVVVDGDNVFALGMIRKGAKAVEPKPSYLMTRDEYGHVTDWPLGGRWNIGGQAGDDRVAQYGKSDFFTKPNVAQKWIDDNHKRIVKAALKSGELSREDYKRLHEEDYGPLPKLTKAEVPKPAPKPEAPAKGENAKPYEGMTLIEYAKSRLPKSQADQITSEDQAKSFKAQYLKEMAALRDTEKAEPETTLQATRSFWKRVFTNETVTADEAKDGFAKVRDNADTLKAELTKLKNDELLRMAGATYRGDPKARLVEGAYSALLTQFAYLDGSAMLSFSMGKGNMERAIQAKVDSLTDESIQQYQEDRKKRLEEYEEHRKATLEGLKDPKTFDDFGRYMRTMMAEGKTEKEARMSLTAEQRERFDNLRIEESRKNKPAAKAPSEKTGATEIKKTVHTKLGHDLYVLDLTTRVSKEAYKELLAEAKKLGGTYSSYRGNGATPGWQFRTEEGAKAFAKLVEGDTTAAAEFTPESSVPDKFEAMADRMDEQANESLSQERKANTERRARFAGYAEEKANSQKAMAKTLRNIAEAIRNGTAGMLSGVSARSHIDTLKSFLTMAKYNEIRALFPENERQDRYGEKATRQTADYAEFPQYTGFRSDLAKLGREMLDNDGTKLLGQRMLKIADDVTKEYLKFATDNLGRVSTFTKKDGSGAVFSSVKAAEAAIKGSGYKGQAIVLPVSRGKNVIIMSPSMAKERGVWEGAIDNRQITLSEEFGNEIVAKAGKNSRGVVKAPWYFDQVSDNRKSLAAMGITTPAEFRAALRDLSDMMAKPAEVDRIKKMEREMAGRANDGLDFFPTSPEVVETMIDTADIQEGMAVLEPSAGMGHIADQIRETGIEPDVVELSAKRKELLEAKGYNVVGSDFMDTEDQQYDRIVMNPPFSNRRDAEHVQHAYGLLKPGGRVVAIMGEGVFFGQDAKAKAFREWLDSVGGTSERLPDNSFQDPTLPVNTGVSARMVVVDKAEAQQIPEDDIMFQSVWHGGPNVWMPEPGFPHGRPRLDLIFEKKAVGEGAWAYGAGFYAAGEMDTAAGYKKPGYSVQAFNLVVRELAKSQGRSNTIIVDGDVYSDFEAATRIQDREQDFIAKLPKNIQDKIETIREGSLYKLEIPDDVLPKLLDWDRPVTDGMYSKIKRQALKERVWFDGMKTVIENDQYRKSTGAQVYHSISEGLADALNTRAGSNTFRLSDIEASKFLARAGIPGNTHGGMSGGKTGAKYVIWDQSVLDEIALLERNGQVLEAMQEAMAQGKPKGMPVKEIESGLKKQIERSAFPVVVFDGSDDLKVSKYRANLKAKEANGEVVKGFYYDGKAFINAQGAVDLEGAALTLLHEQIGHGGVEAFLGDDFNPFLDMLNRHTKYHPGVAEVGKKRGYNMATEKGRRRAGAEWFAQSIENNTLEPNLWTRFLKILKDAFRKMGIDIQIGDAELAEVVRGAYQAAMKREARQSGIGNLATDIRYSVASYGEIPKSVIDKLKKIHPEVDAFVSMKNDNIILHELQMPKTIRNQGLGTAFMDILTDYADANGKTISLTAAGDYGGSRAGQERFYRRHGFVPNKGRNKDYRINENMIRRPKENALTQTDKAYMQAVEAGDMAAAEKIVAKAAADAGYTIKAYHGTDKDFTVFKKSKYGSNGPGVYLTTNKSIAEGHGGKVVESYVRIRNDKDGKIAGHEVIVYRPENIKSSDPIVRDDTGQIIPPSKRFNPEMDDIRFSVADRLASWLPAKEQTTYSGITTAEQNKNIADVFGVQKTLIERAQDFSKNWKKNVIQGVFDQFSPLFELDPMAYIQARMTKGGDSTLEAILMYGKPYYDKVNAAIKVRFDRANKGMNGFASILAPLDGEHDLFLKWVSAKRAESLKSVGLENLMTEDNIRVLKTLNRGTMRNGKSRPEAYRKALEGLNEYNDAILQIAVDRGLINDATRQMYQNTPYLPFYRLADENQVSGFTVSAGLVNQYAWKRLKGGTAKLNDDMLANLLQNWSHLVTASARNEAAKTSLEAGVVAGIAQEVPSGYPGKGLVSFRDNVTTELKKDASGAYVRVEKYILEGQAYIEDGVEKISDGTVQQEVNTERTFIVSDPHVLDAITSIGQTLQVPKTLKTFKHFLTIGVTANPAFKIRNLLRDSLASMALADMSYNPVKNVSQGFKLAKLNSEARAQLLASGGIIRFGAMLDGANADNARGIIEGMGIQKDHILDDSNKVAQFWKHRVKPAIDAYQEFGDRGEQVNRLTLYTRLMEKGMSHGEASFWARDLMDFSMSGKWQAVRFLAQTVPFLNARLQGLYKLGRSTKADKRRVAYVVGGVTLASLALLAAYGDDDDWKKREDWDRDNYWWFKVGGLAFRIPKPFEIGAIGTLAERSAELMFDDEMTGKRFRRRIGNIVSQQLSMNPTPQLIKPLIDLWANKDSFSGRPIEGMGMERLKPEDRFNERTTGIAKMFGSLGLPNPAQLMMGNYEKLSPAQIDFLVRGYFSWMGTMTTTAMDYGIFKPISDKGASPSLQLRDVFFVGNFAETLPTGSSRYVTQMYEQAKEIEQAYASYRNALKIGDKERASEIMQSDGSKIRQYKIISRLKRQESALNQQAKEIQNNNNLSSGAKRRRLDEINAQKDRIARRVARIE